MLSIKQKEEIYTKVNRAQKLELEFAKNRAFYFCSENKHGMDMLTYSDNLQNFIGLKNELSQTNEVHLILQILLRIVDNLSHNDASNISNTIEFNESELIDEIANVLLIKDVLINEEIILVIIRIFYYLCSKDQNSCCTILLTLFYKKTHLFLKLKNIEIVKILLMFLTEILKQEFCFISFIRNEIWESIFEIVNLNFYNDQEIEKCVVYFFFNASKFFEKIHLQISAKIMQKCIFMIERNTDFENLMILFSIIQFCEFSDDSLDILELVLTQNFVKKCINFLNGENIKLAKLSTTFFSILPKIKSKFSFLLISPQFIKIIINILEVNVDKKLSNSVLICLNNTIVKFPEFTQKFIESNIIDSLCFIIYEANYKNCIIAFGIFEKILEKINQNWNILEDICYVIFDSLAKFHDLVFFKALILLERFFFEGEINLDESEFIYFKRNLESHINFGIIENAKESENENVSKIALKIMDYYS